MREAFRVYDPDGTGHVDPSALRLVLAGLGHGEVTDDDLSVLLQAAGADADGRVSLESFRAIASGSSRRRSSCAVARSRQKQLSK